MTGPCPAVGQEAARTDQWKGAEREEAKEKRTVKKETETETKQKKSLSS